MARPAIPRDVIDPRPRRRTMAAEDDGNHILASQSAKKVLGRNPLDEICTSSTTAT